MVLFFVAVLLFIVLSLSFLKEFPKIDGFLNRFPVLMTLIPTWSFFAPTPGMSDYYLLYREINDKDEVQDWKEVTPLQDKRSPFAFVWNPDKKYLKTLIDMVQQLIKLSVAYNEEKQICLTVPYLHILNSVTSLEHGSSAKKVQFLIMGGSRLCEYTVEFVSSVHPISGR